MQRNKFPAFCLARWPTVLALLVAFGAVGVALARLVPPQYDASMVVTAARFADDAKPGNVSGPLSLLTGGEGAEMSDFSLYLELLRSRRMAEIFFERHPDLVHRVFASEWDGHQWRRPDTLKQGIKNAFFGLVGVAAWSPPDVWRLGAFLGKMDISRDMKRPVATVTFTHPDRDLAVNVLFTLHAEAERLIKKDAEERSSAKTAFMNDLGNGIENQAMRRALTDIQLRNALTYVLGRAPVPFAAEFISEPSAPALPNGKRLLLVPVMCSIVGAALVMVIVFLVGQIRDARRVALSVDETGDALS